MAFEKIVIVMLENSLRSDVIKNQYMSDLRQQGVFLSNSHGVTHPSQPNYILSIAGDNFGISSDEPGYVQWLVDPTKIEHTKPVTSIVDLLEAHDLTWRAYAEDMRPDYKDEINTAYPYTPIPPDNKPSIIPTDEGGSGIPEEKGHFARKHVPFLSFPNIISNPQRLANIVDGKQFEIDLAEGNLPHYSWYTPNMMNDGHNVTIDELAEAAKIKVKDGPDAAQAYLKAQRINHIATFLQGFLSDDPISKFPPETLIVITFDEAYPYFAPYEIYTLLIGDMLQAGTRRRAPYNHYSLLRSVELNFGLGTLKRNDATAIPYWFLRP
ncbi:MAG: alkaline phosphatase family protein [Ardenticatenaceae bacterium]